MIRDYTNPAADSWYRSLLHQPEQLPVSFSYNAKRYCGFSDPDLTMLDRQTRREGEKEESTIRYSLLEQLTLSIKLTHYFSHGVTEWTVWFENTAGRDSGVLEDIKCQLRLPGERPVLKGILGDHENFYRPYAYDLAQQPVGFTSDSGRATHVYFPYFNLEYGCGGAMLAIGWAGTWSADFTTDGQTTTYTANSVNGLKTYLKPGETIRTALFVFAPYTQRDEHYATNFWRSWYTQHNMPPADASGKSLEPFSSCCLASDTGLLNSDGSISERHTTWRPTMEKMLAEDIKVDFRWFDAGWYVTPYLASPEPFVQGRDWWDTVGTWELDPAKWPGKTFLESTDFAREHGMRTLMWFEPERVTYPDDLSRNFGYKREWAIERPGERAISNNIGDPECLRWTTERVCKVLRENKVEMYREDNNSDPAALWAFLDAKESGQRSGITECKFINAHYKMWDDIIACTLSFGGCGFVDSCASGGGRNDLESMRRGIPLLRSDYDRTTTALRLSMTTAFNRWIPFCGANTKEKKEQLALTGDSDVYIWRASYLAALNVDSQFVQDPDQNFDMLRFGLREWKKVSPYLLKEFYPLTPWHPEEDTTGFTAYAFFDPETESGVLLAFRQEKCAESQLTLQLPATLGGGNWTLTDEDSGEVWAQEAAALSIHFDAPRSARLLWIRRG